MIEEAETAEISARMKTPMRCPKVSCWVVVDIWEGERISGHQAASLNEDLIFASASRSSEHTFHFVFFSGTRPESK
jgi:hypothetical protein